MLCNVYFTVYRSESTQSIPASFGSRTGNRADDRGSRSGWVCMEPGCFRTVEEKPVPTRADQIKRLASGEEFDILVVGGGATGPHTLVFVEASAALLDGERRTTGAGVALEAQLRGLKVACVEQERPCFSAVAKRAVGGQLVPGRLRIWDFFQIHEAPLGRCGTRPLLQRVVPQVVAFCLSLWPAQCCVCMDIVSDRSQQCGAQFSVS